MSMAARPRIITSKAMDKRTRINLADGAGCAFPEVENKSRWHKYKAIARSYLWELVSKWALPG